MNSCDMDDKRMYENLSERLQCGLTDQIGEPHTKRQRSGYSNDGGEQCSYGQPNMRLYSPRQLSLLEHSFSVIVDEDPTA